MKTSPSSRYHRSNFSIDMVDVIPDLTDLVLAVADDFVVDGYGNAKDVYKILGQFEEDLATAIQQLRHGATLEPLYIPDLWHITWGRARMFSPVDANRIYEAWVLAHCIAHNYMQPSSSGPSMRDGYPGSSFVTK